MNFSREKRLATHLPTGEPSIVSMEVMGSLAVQVKSTKTHNYAHWWP